MCYWQIKNDGDDYHMLSYGATQPYSNYTANYAICIEKQICSQLPGTSVMCPTVFPVPLPSAAEKLLAGKWKMTYNRDNVCSSTKSRN